MDWNRIEGNWKQAKGKIKEKWGDLTDDDLDKIAGRRNQREGKIQERYGIEWLCRTADRIDPTRVRGSFHRLRRGASTPHPANLRSLLQ